MSVPLSPRALRQVEALVRHYAALGREEAVRNVRRAVLDAEAQIENGADRVLAAPRSYPELISLGLSWLHVGRYWIAYRDGLEPTIVGVIWDSADISRRMRED